MLQKQRLIDGYGHVTARLADGRILSTPHMPPGKAALRDLIIIDMQGNKLEGSGEPNGENAMHTSIYKAVPMCSVFSTIIRTNWCRQARRIRELER